MRGDRVIVGGVNATKTSLIRAMRSVKKETLCLIREFVTQFPDATVHSVFILFIYFSAP